MHPGDHGVSEVISVIFMVILVIILGVIVGVGFFGGSFPGEKTAYLVTEASAVTISNASVVQVLHLEGDAVSFAPATASGIPVNLSMTNGSVTYDFVPLAGPLQNGWKPGETIYLFRNESGAFITDSHPAVENTVGFPAGTWMLNIVDSRAHVLVAQQSVTTLGGSVTPTPTPISYPRYPGFTAESWVKWNSVPTPGDSSSQYALIVMDGNNDNDRVYLLGHNQDNSKFEFRIRMADNREGYGWSGTGPQKGVWYHLAEVYNQTPGTFTIYVNGNPDSSWTRWTTNTGGIHSSTGTYQVGGTSGITYWGVSGQRKFNGEIQGLSIIHEALSPQEIHSQYLAGHA